MSHRLHILHGGPTATRQVQLERASRGTLGERRIVAMCFPYEPTPRRSDLFIAFHSLSLLLIIQVLRFVAKLKTIIHHRVLDSRISRSRPPVRRLTRWYIFLFCEAVLGENLSLIFDLESQGVYLYLLSVP